MSIAAQQRLYPQMASLYLSLAKELARWGKAAVREALLEWRDRTTPPGVRARFRPAAASFYGWHGYSANTKASFWRKGGVVTRVVHARRPYYDSGALMRMLAKRKPKVKGKVSNHTVEAALKIGGGALNFLKNKYPVKHRQVTENVKTVQMPPTMIAAHTRAGRYGPIYVGSYMMPARTWQVRTRDVHKVYAAKSFRDQFGVQSADEAFVAEATERHFQRILQGAAVKKISKNKAKAINTVLGASIRKSLAARRAARRSG